MNGETGTRPKVAVLMAVFEDARFLPEQLSSIRAQSHENFEVWISRDCEDEDVGTVLEEQLPTFGADRFFVLEGPQQGCSANFLSLIFNPEIRADYFAYSDQDDVWYRDKLSRAIAVLEHAPDAAPALYGSRTRLIDENGRDVGLSPLYRRPPCFRNALAQNIASGHTMVMNRAAHELLCASGVREGPIHDWWTYLLITGAGGKMFYDPHPSAQYRQHDRNLTGSSVRPSDHIRRLARIVSGDFRDSNATNCRALYGARHLLTPENRRIFDIYHRAVTESRLSSRPREILKSGVFRQRRAETLGLLAASLLNKV